MEEQKKEKPRGDRRPRRGGRPGGRPGDRSGGRNNGRYRRDRNERNPKIEALVKRIKEELIDSIEPITIPELNAFERKLIHRQFDNSPDIVTKTYRLGDDDYELRVYPVGNLKRYAQQKADEAVQTRQKVVLPHMSNYERFVVHDYLKEIDTVNSSSEGEDDDRHIVIEPAVFGRGLRRMIKKIKLF
jgi:predicted RNA-binding protein Jag